MYNFAYLILRISLGITFVWIGVLMFQNPEAWGGFVKPWVREMLPIPLKEMMIGTAILDVLIGVFLLIGRLSFIAAFLGAVHLLGILITSGITSVTIRDVGLLGAAIAIMLMAYNHREEYQ